MKLMHSLIRNTCLLSALWISGASLLPAETLFFNGKDFTGGYCLVPDAQPGPGEVHWVCVDVHGAGGLRNGNRGVELKQLLAPTPVIVIVPSFTDGFQSGNGDWAKQLIDHFELIQKRYKVHDRMFIHGHSGGAQFAHRFAFNHPDRVLGISAHSAGSWASGDGFGDLNAAARKIPFAISCGEQDMAKSMPAAPYTRIEWYRRFEEQMKKKGFVYVGGTWPGTGHSVPMSHYATMLKECFRLATVGEMPKEGKWNGNVKAIADVAARQAKMRR